MQATKSGSIAAMQHDDDTHVSREDVHGGLETLPAEPKAGHPLA